MLRGSFVTATGERQGCRVVTGDAGGLVAELAPDRRVSPRCGRCGERGWYQDTRGARRVHHLPLWGDRGGAPLLAAARELSAMGRRACRVAPLGQWDTADGPRSAGDAILDKVKCIANGLLSRDTSSPW